MQSGVLIASAVVAVARVPLMAMLAAAGVWKLTAFSTPEVRAAFP